MIRLLIIGRPGAAWAQRIRETVGDALELETARLPSAGIRQFEATPADVILIVDERGGERVETLIQAIRNRPLGQLVPLLLICPLPGDMPVQDKISALDLLGWLPLEASVHDLWRIIDEELGLSHDSVDEAPFRPSTFEESASSSAPTPPTFPGAMGANSPSAFALEPLDEPEPGPNRASRSIFPSRGGFEIQGGIDAESIERKLKEVRHQDYYAILEVRRGAESQTVREAFHRLVARFDPRSIDFELAHRYQNEVAEIGDALEDAWAVLGDPDLRQPYLTHTLRK